MYKNLANCNRVSQSDIITIARNMDPKTDFDFVVYTFLALFLKCIGLNVISARFRPGGMSILYATAICTGCAFEVYTITCLDAEIRMQGISIIGLIFQGVLKYFNYLLNGCMNASNVWSDAVNFLDAVYVQCESGGTWTQRTLKRWMRNYRIMSIGYLCMVCITVLTYFMYPAYSLIVWRENAFPMPLMVPLLDARTAVGIAVNWTFQLGMITCAGVGLIGGDLLMVLLMQQICPLSAILCEKLRSMGAGLVRAGRRGDQRGDRRTREFLHNCLHMHKEFVHYMRSIAANYYWIFSMEILSNFMSMCYIMYAMMVMQWPVLYSMFVGFTLKTFYVCAVGTMIEMHVREMTSVEIATAH